MDNRLITKRKSLSTGSVNASTDITSGTLPIARGGTATGSTPTNGQLLVGNGTDYTLATLTQSHNIAVTNGAGTITVATSTTDFKDANGNELFKFSATASAVNEVTVTNAATGGNASIAATGDDTNIKLSLAGKGTGTVLLGSNLSMNTKSIVDANGNELITFTETASAVNNVRIENNATGSPPVIVAAGDDTNIDLWVASKGTGPIVLVCPSLVLYNNASIADANTNELIKFSATASAVNEVTVTNAATGNAPQIAATGGDTNINLNLAGKGAGVVNVASILKILRSYSTINTVADGATITFDLSLSREHATTLGGNRTLAISNEQVGQWFIVFVGQDGTGSRTVTWWSGIDWAGGSAPTLTATASKIDTFAFYVVSAGKYRGYVVGANTPA